MSRIPICRSVEVQIRIRLPNNNGRAKTWSSLNTRTEMGLQTASRTASVESIETRGGGDHKMAPWVSLGLHDGSNSIHHNALCISFPSAPGAMTIPQIHSQPHNGSFLPSIKTSNHFQHPPHGVHDNFSNSHLPALGCTYRYAAVLKIVCFYLIVYFWPPLTEGWLCLEYVGSGIFGGTFE